MTNQSHRLPQGGQINRRKPLSFTFDGTHSVSYTHLRAHET